MSIKDLFDNKGVTKIQKSVSSDDLVAEVESKEFVGSKRKQFDTFIPPIDFASASNFAKFGSAELYYEKAFERIHNYYPYDGTLHEKIEFENSSSYLDKYVFDNLYPRTNGYINFLSSQNNYVSVFGGPHTASSGMDGKLLDSTFDSSMKYDAAKKRTSAFEFRGEDGVTMEFWLKVPSVAAGIQKTILQVTGTTAPQQLANTTGDILLAQYNDQLRLIVKSGSVSYTPIFDDILTADGWNYYAISLKYDSGNLISKAYKNGQLFGQDEATKNIQNILPATHGLNLFVGSGSATVQPTGLLTGSMDELRYWKKERTPEQIFNNWFVHIGGGTNDFDSNVDLGCYLKFNEGITGNTAIDSTALDYSGRINNGKIVNYASSVRNTGSAITEKLGEPEFLDPIIYSSHPSVVSSKAQYKTSGSLSDLENSSMLYSYFPGWMQETDEQNGKQLKFLSQVMGSYFDTLWHQIDFVNKIHDNYCVSGSNKALPFAKKLLYNKGFVMPDLFVDATIVERLNKKDDNEVYEKEINEVRNLIYHNIYNNLNSIFKSKGTEKSFRNFFRSVGIGQDLVKLNLYADDSTFVLRNNYEYKSYERKYLDFNVDGHFDGTIFQTTSSNNSNIYIPGDTVYHGAFSVQSEIILPRKQKKNEPNYNPYPYLTSSLFGYHTGQSYTYPATDRGLQVFIIHSASQDSLNPDDKQRVKFMLTGSDPDLPDIKLTSSWFPQQYENNKWSIAVRMKHATYPTPNITGITADDYLVEFYGVEADGNTERNSFSLTSSGIARSYYSSDKIFYAGAHRQNFKGSTLQYTDVKLGYVRYWHSYLSNDAIKQHAFDSETFGTNEPFESDLVNTYPSEIPREKTLAFHWAFHDLTASNHYGEFDITDLSSGSSDSDYATLNDTIQRTVAARGLGFNNSSKKIVDKMFIQAARKRRPDDLMSSDLVTVQNDETENFFIDDDVSDNFYSFEKSLWGTISDEMLNMFSTALDLNNLIGQPNQRYHHKYRLANFLRDRFFDDVKNEPDLEKFSSFYKWIDDSISLAIQQLIPASSRFSSKINNIIESHVLERNKYVHQIPILTNFQSTEGSIKGISEMKYNWKFGHAVNVPRASTIIRTVAEASLVDTKDFALTDSEGVTTTYNLTMGRPTSINTGSYTPGTTVDIGMVGATTREDVRDQLITRINAGTNIGFTASGTGQNVLVIQNTAGSLGNTVVTDEGTGLTIPNFSGGDDNEENNTLWHIDRKEKTGLREVLRNSRNNHSIQSAGLSRKEIDGSTRISDTYSVRRFAKTVEIGLVSQEIIHGGTNFGRKKNLQFFHESIAPAGRIESVPQNIVTVGVGDGFGIVEEPPNNDLSPRKKKYEINALVGNRSAKEYGYNVNGNSLLPLNIMSGTVDSGFNFFLETSFSSGVHLTNLHNDVVGNYNETSIQSPFTEQHVGGLQYRHIDINEGSDIETTRPEGWRILLKDHAALGPDADGAFGFVGPDYETPYPSSRLRKANFYRDEHAKRPINVRNIKTTGSQQKAGNYKSELDIFQVSPTFQKTWAIEANDNPNVKILPSSISSGFPKTTNYQTLVGRDGSATGNVFGVYNNNRQIDETIGDRLSLSINSGETSTIVHRLASDTTVSGYSTTGNKSISFWVNLDTSSTTLRYVFTIYNTSGAADALAVFFSSNNLSLSTRTTGGAKVFKWAVTMSNFVDTWSNVVIVWDGDQSSNPILYINGSSEGTPDSTSGTATGTTLSTMNGISVLDRFGVNSAGQELQGSLMNLGIWEAALTSGNATTIYNSGIVLSTPILQGSLIDFYFLGNELSNFSIGDEITNGTTVPSSFGSGNNDLVAQDGLVIVQGLQTQNRLLANYIPPERNNTIAKPRTDLTGSQRNILTRFSAPGGPEIQTIGFLDAYTTTYSVHNAMPFRNSSVLGSGSGEQGTIRVEDHLGHRRGLRTLRALHMGKFGIDSTFGSITEASYPTNGSFNKQHRNTSKRRENGPEQDIGSATQASGSFNMTDTGPSTVQSYNNGVFAITSGDGTTKNYIFKNGGGKSTGDLDSGRVVIQVSGKTFLTVGEQVVNAIQSANGHLNKMTATFDALSDETKIIVTVADRVGTAGNGASIANTSCGAKFVVDSPGSGQPFNNGGPFVSNIQPTLITGSSNDNMHINSPIPRSEFQYSWINSAIPDPLDGSQHVMGYAPRDGIISSSAGFVEAIVFPTASNIFGS